jgi:hypothetical protein
MSGLQFPTPGTRVGNGYPSGDPYPPPANPHTPASMPPRSRAARPYSRTTPTRMFPQGAGAAAWSGDVGDGGGGGWRQAAWSGGVGDAGNGWGGAGRNGWGAKGCS